MRRLLSIALLAAAFFVFGWETEASAKQGPYLGLDLVYNSPSGDLSGDFAEVDPGAGFDLKFGYIFPAPIALEFEWGGTGHDVEGFDAGIGFFVINLRFFFITEQPFNPYFRLGIGTYALVIEDVPDPFGSSDDMKLTGQGFDIGIGFDYYVSPNVTLGAGLTQRFVTYDDVDYLNYILIDDVEGDMTSLNFGAQYHF